MKFASVILLLIAVAAALLVFGDSRVFGGVKFGETVEAMALGVLVMTIASSALLHFRGRLSTAMLSLIAWFGIFAVVVTGYAYRNELTGVASRVMDEVVPGREVASQKGEAVIVRDGGGHFVFNGLTNGARLRYLFDTGASTVVLTAEDAQKIGFNPASLNYSVTVSTANGRTSAAPITIDALSVGNITVRNVRAMAARPGALQQNLLGMSFLSRLRHYSVEGNRLVLRQ